MINLITFFSWFLFCLNCFSADDCSNFREGVFIYKEASLKGVKIYRTLNDQIEIVGDTLVVSFSIKWIGDCPQ